LETEGFEFKEGEVDRLAALILTLKIPQWVYSDNYIDFIHVPQLRVFKLYRPLAQVIL